MLTNVSHVMYIILAPLGGVFMAAINILTVFIFVKKFRLQTFSVILIINICACDIFVSTFSNFFYVINLLHPTYAWTTGNLSCKVFKMVTMTTNVAQIFSLCFINADRLRRLVSTVVLQWNKSHGIRALVLVWVAALCLGVPRLFLFEEVVKQRMDPDSNETVIRNIVCKPVDMKQTWYVASSIVLFVLAYALPTCYVLYTTVRAQVFMWHRRRQVHLATKNARVLKMNHALSLTFNLTAALFLLVWSPFFILSIVDLGQNHSRQPGLKGVNFSLRCTLLLIGSAKPVIYVICLEKFRNALKCAALFGGEKDKKGISSSSCGGRSTTDADSTRNTKVANVSEKCLMLLESSNRPLTSIMRTTEC